MSFEGRIVSLCETRILGELGRSNNRRFILLKACRKFSLSVCFKVSRQIYSKCILFYLKYHQIYETYMKKILPYNITYRRWQLVLKLRKFGVQARYVLPACRIITVGATMFLKYWRISFKRTRLTWKPPTSSFVNPYNFHDYYSV